MTLETTADTPCSRNLLLGRLSGSFDGVDNLVALVTGANKGIGKEIARQLAGAGLTVYVGSRDALGAAGQARGRSSATCALAADQPQSLSRRVQAESAR